MSLGVDPKTFRMLKIYHTNKRDFLIWDLHALPILEDARITFDYFGRSADSCLPIRLTLEKAELLVQHLKVACYCKAEYLVPNAEELETYEGVYRTELADWQVERSIYESKMKAIYTSNEKTAIEDMPLKPVLPISIETKSCQPWCKLVADPSAKEMAAHFGDRYEKKCKIFLSLWLDGWWIGEGSKFGGDYLLYREKPDKCHSSYIVCVIYGNGKDETSSSSSCSLPPLSYRDLMCASRLANVTKKVLVFCYFDPIADKTRFISCDWTGWN